MGKKVIYECDNCQNKVDDLILNEGWIHIEPIGEEKGIRLSISVFDEKAKKKTDGFYVK